MSTTEQPTEVWAFPGTVATSMHTARDEAALRAAGLDPADVAHRERRIECRTFGCTRMTGNVMGGCDLDAHYVHPSVIDRARAALHGTASPEWGIAEPAPVLDAVTAAAPPARPISTTVNIHNVSPADISINTSGDNLAWLNIGPHSLFIQRPTSASTLEQLWGLEALGAHIVALAKSKAIELANTSDSDTQFLAAAHLIGAPSTDVAAA